MGFAINAELQGLAGIRKRCLSDQKSLPKKTSSKMQTTRLTKEPMYQSGSNRTFWLVFHRQRKLTGCSSTCVTHCVVVLWWTAKTEYLHSSKCNRRSPSTRYAFQSTVSCSRKCSVTHVKSDALHITGAANVSAAKCRREHPLLADHCTYHVCITQLGCHNNIPSPYLAGIGKYALASSAEKETVYLALANEPLTGAYAQSAAATPAGTSVQQASDNFLLDHEQVSASISTHGILALHSVTLHCSTALTCKCTCIRLQVLAF